MAKKLWFIKQDDSLVDVFSSKREALLEYESDQEEDNDAYELYALDIDDLEDYPEELELAEENGFV